jgi:guanylate kinase
LGSSTASRPKPLVLAVTGTSGAGKGTLEQALLRRPEFELAVSATTRERRPGEREGREYYFISDEEFTRLVDEGKFIEHIRHPWGPRHGTLWSEIERIQAASRVAVLDLETEGALAIQKRIPNTVTVFVRAPTFDELERRLRERATESGGEIEERLDAARDQLELADRFDHVIVNDDAERASRELVEIADRALEAAGSMSRR